MRAAVELTVTVCKLVGGEGAEPGEGNCHKNVHGTNWYIHSLVVASTMSEIGPAPWAVWAETVMV